MYGRLWRDHVCPWCVHLLIVLNILFFEESGAREQRKENRILFSGLQDTHTCYEAHSSAFGPYQARWFQQVHGNDIPTCNPLAVKPTSCNRWAVWPGRWSLIAFLQTVGIGVGVWCEFGEFNSKNIHFSHIMIWKASFSLSFFLGGGGVQSSFAISLCGLKLI